MQYMGIFTVKYSTIQKGNGRKGLDGYFSTV